MELPYSKKTEDRMRLFYESLSEKDRRRYAGIEAYKLMYGGQTYISEVLGCDLKTIREGLADLEDEEELKKNE